MALPFALLAMGLALNVLLAAQRPDWMRTLFYGICVGSLVFLNTWDAPIYIMALVGADALRRFMQRGRWLADDWVEMIAFGGALLVITVVAYSPFLIGFRSQLAGVLPNVINPTHFPQLFLMFGPFFFLPRRLYWRGSLAWGSDAALQSVLGVGRGWCAAFHPGFLGILGLDCGGRVDPGRSTELPGLFRR